MVSIKEQAKVALNNVGNFFSKPTVQRKALDENVNKGVDTVYSAISKQANKFNQFLINTIEDRLNKPVFEANFKRITIKEDESSNKIGLKKTANKIINFHEKVINVGGKIAHETGYQVRSLVYVALEPIRFVAKLLQVKVAGEILTNSISLAVGYAVRAAVFAASQLGHLVPYAAAIGMIGGVGASLAALSIQVSPLVALGAGMGLILLAQQAQIAILSKEVGNQTDAIRSMQRQAFKERQAAAEAAQNTLSAKAKRLAANAYQSAANNKGKIAIGAAITAGAIAGGAAAYQYGLPTFATEAYNKASAYAADAANAVSESANRAYTQTSTAVKGAFDSANNYVESLEIKNRFFETVETVKGGFSDAFFKVAGMFSSSNATDAA